jgi:CRISPR-associated protein Csd1
MLLQRLVEYARSSPDVVPPFYGRKPVRWVLDLNPDGTPAGDLIDLADASEPGRRFGASHVVPAITRTVGVAPTLAVDTPEYVFGWVSDVTKQERVARQHEAFRELTSEWARTEKTEGPARTIAAFYQAGHHRKVPKPAEWGRSDLVAFRVRGEFACKTAEAVRFWAVVAGGRKGLGQSSLCLVCGQVRPLLKTIPQQIQRRHLPGATQSASLVSVNEAVHGYGLQKFLANTPICIDCGLSTMTALTALLSSERHSSTYSGQDTRLAWWLTGAAHFDPIAMVSKPDEAEVQQLLASAARGDLFESDNLAMFCALAVGGNVARVVVRDWVEMPLPKVQQNLRRWFRDHEIVDEWTGEVVHCGVGRLAAVSGRWQAGRGNGKGSYARFGSSGEDRPDGVYRALLRSALLSKALPPRLLAHVVHRIRTDGRVDAARVALIRLALRRRPFVIDPEAYMPALGMDIRDPAYLSGRLFAVLEDLQRVSAWAYGQRINTTFTDRYFGRAVTNPMVAIVAGRRDARAWLKRLRRERPGWAAAYEKRLDDLFNQLAEVGGMPLGAVVTQQAAFILGYHQQRAALRAERTQKSSGKQTDLPPADDENSTDPEGETE